MSPAHRRGSKHRARPKAARPRAHPGPCQSRSRDPCGDSAQCRSESNACPSRDLNPRAIQQLRDPSCTGRDGEQNDLEEVLLLLHIPLLTPTMVNAF